MVLDGQLGCVRVGSHDRDRLLGAAGSRTRMRADRHPDSASASSTEVAVAPPPSTTAERAGEGNRSCMAAMAPGMSVLKPCLPSSSRTRVLATPESRTQSSLVSSRGTTVRLSGIVRESPRHESSRPVMKASRPAESTSTWS